MKMRGRRLGFGLVLVAALVVSATTTAFVSDQNGSTTVTAMFADADPLIPGNSVRAAGVEVGTIEDVNIEDGLAKVEMEITDDVGPMYEDATAKIVVDNLLGERFVELSRGSPDAGDVSDPVVIPEERTERLVDLQEVVDAVDKPTSEALAALVTTLGEGTGDQGEQVASAISALEPAMNQSHELAGILSEQNELLGSLVDNAKGPAEALAGERGQNLDRLVDSGTRTLNSVAENREEVQDTLGELPSTLASARRTLADVSGVADPTADTLESIRPVTDDLTGISRELQNFTDAADPALASLPPVLSRGERLVNEARPLVDDLKPAGEDLRSVADSGETLTEEALSTRLTNLVEFARGWTFATSDYDAISHYFKAMLPLTPKALGQMAGGPVPGVDKPVPDTGNLLPESPDLPFPGRDEDGQQLLPPLGGDDQQGPLPSGGDQAGNDGGADGDSATGLTEEQENSMLGQLLGGS